MAHAAVGDRGAAGKHRLVERAVDRGDQPRAARAADVAEKSLEDAAGWRRPTARSAIRWSCSCIVPPTSSCVSSPTRWRSFDADDVLVEREADRRGVADRVVEQPHVDVSTVASTSSRSTSASSPATRIEPLATAVVYGDSFGTNSRT